MNERNGPEPSEDLQSILARLASSAPRHPPERATIEDDVGRFNTADRNAAPVTVVHPHWTSQDPSTEQDHRPQRLAATASPKPVIDPASITTWQDGLRCVTKIAAQDADFATSIRRLMREQRVRESRWYSERLSLKQTQANRSSSSAIADAILSSLVKGSSASPSSDVQPHVDHDAELTDFDRKVYAEQRSMEAATTSELKSLGVPFFGTDPSLIRPESHTESNLSLSGDRPKWSPFVSEGQLLALRRKMVAHLEDLYRD